MDCLLDDAARDLPVQVRIVFRPARVRREDRVLLEGVAQDIALGVDDRGLRAPVP